MDMCYVVSCTPFVAHYPTLQRDVILVDLELNVTEIGVHTVSNATHAFMKMYVFIYASMSLAKQPFAF